VELPHLGREGLAPYGIDMRPDIAGVRDCFGISVHYCWSFVWGI
jgi:hypothetical protein